LEQIVEPWFFSSSVPQINIGTTQSRFFTEVHASMHDYRVQELRFCLKVERTIE